MSLLSLLEISVGCPAHRYSHCTDCATLASWLLWELYGKHQVWLLQINSVSLFAVLMGSDVCIALGLLDHCVVRCDVFVWCGSYRLAFQLHLNYFCCSMPVRTHKLLYLDHMYKLLVSHQSFGLYAVMLLY